MIEGGIGDGMKIVGNGDGDLNRVRVAGLTIGVHDDRSRRCAIGNARNHEIV